MRIDELRKPKGTMKSLYVSRAVLNREAIRDWARSNGFSHTLPSEDFHVTIAFSKELFDWDKAEPDTECVYIAPSDSRKLKVFDGGAVVVNFKNEILAERWQDLIDLGASNSYPDYKAHVTITYKGKPKKAVAYPGEIVLGPEIWKEVNTEWKKEMTEISLKD